MFSYDIIFIHMKVKFKTFNDYLEIIVSGELTKDLPEKAKPKFIKKECDKRRIKKIFINAINISGYFSTMDRFKIANEYAESFSGTNIKISLVSNKNLIFPEEFFETVSINRGVNIRVFIDIEKAKKWLLEKNLNF